MRKFKTILGIAAVFAAVLGFIGCSSDSDDDEPEPKIAVSVVEGVAFKAGDEVTNDKLSVTKDEKSVNSEEFEILDVVVADEGESKGKSIKGEDGKFIIPAAGKYAVTIKLKSGGKSMSCEITATEKQNGDDNNDDKNDDQNNDNNDNNDDNKTEEDAALTAAKAEKVATLNAYEPEGYSALDEEKKTAIAEKLATAKTEGATAINAADSVENVNLAFESAKAKIDNIVKALTQTAAEAKVDALLQLDEHIASVKSTFAEEDTIIGGLIDTAAETQKSAIEAAATAEGATSEQVYEALETAKTAIDQVAADRKATSYNVKYYDGTEEIQVANDSKTVKYGATIKKPSVADKEDARLETWLITADGAEYDFTKAIYAEKDTEIQLYAKWKQSDATISFTLDGATYGNAINAFSGDKFGDYALLVPVAKEAGKKVSDWQKDGTPLDLTSEIPAGATSLSATTLNEWKTNAELGNGVSSNFASKDLISAPTYNDNGIAEQTYTSAMIANEALYSISTSNFTECSLINFNEGKTKTVENTPIKSTFRSANIVKGTTSKSIFITAKENISLTLIAGLGDSKWSSGRIGGVYYTINSGAETEFAASSDKKLISGKKTIALNAKDILAIYGKVDASSDGSRLWIFDVEATIADSFTNATVEYYNEDKTTLYKKDETSSVKGFTLEAGPTIDGKAFKGWSTNSETFTQYSGNGEITAGEIIKLYPFYEEADVTLKFYDIENGIYSQKGESIGKNSTSDTISENDAPTVTAGSNNKFIGWFTKEGENYTKYTFGSALTAGTLELYARYEAIASVGGYTTLTNIQNYNDLDAIPPSDSTDSSNHVQYHGTAFELKSADTELSIENGPTVVKGTKGLTLTNTPGDSRNIRFIGLETNKKYRITILIANYDSSTRTPNISKTTSNDTTTEGWSITIEKQQKNGPINLKELQVEFTATQNTYYYHPNKCTTFSIKIEEVTTTPRDVTTLSGTIEEAESTLDLSKLSFTYEGGSVALNDAQFEGKITVVEYDVSSSYAKIIVDGKSVYTLGSK